MARLTLRLRGTKSQLVQALHEVPSWITGSQADRHNIGKVFKAHFARSVFTRIHAAFMDKSAGGSDELGNTWKPLAASTRQSGLRGKRALLQGKRGILIKTGRLEESLRPGAATGDFYQKPRDQIVKLERGSISLGTGVPYARFHHLGTRRIPRRRLWPSAASMRPWVRDAAAYAAEMLARSFRYFQVR